MITFIVNFQFLLLLNTPSFNDFCEYKLFEIRLFFDRNRIPIPQDIDDVFNATTQSLDEIIRQAALMQEIGVDQLNQIEGLQTLLGESLDRNREKY
ncbi:hypothetical protein RhiirA4_466797 [Rhizophagus irregularis]|uniref:Uncharacterized protein n=1 Tax=Rhizophagus irregularis TaxID=588596 RepID=A0A2I1GUM1_9GLOM|nr:hypothetical protein RhiirA4_466797 [Rhizophagus irregularis]